MVRKRAREEVRVGWPALPPGGGEARAASTYQRLEVHKSQLRPAIWDSATTNSSKLREGSRW
jgi:hypothetical protein